MVSSLIHLLCPLEICSVNIEGWSDFRTMMVSMPDAMGPLGLSTRAETKPSRSHP
jgi:hypothetical protein